MVDRVRGKKEEDSLTLKLLDFKDQKRPNEHSCVLRAWLL